MRLKYQTRSTEKFETEKSQMFQNINLCTDVWRLHFGSLLQGVGFGSGNYDKSLWI